jgi:hypothetical protein
MIWYAAYGSNLSYERFMHYIRGGIAIGARRRLPGCRDAAPPEEHEPHELAGDLLFAGRSMNWSGHGVAFLDLDVDATVKSRIYLVSDEQFDDIIAQENARIPGDVTPGDHAGWYDVVVERGSVRGYPVMTITSGETRETNPPSPDYIRHVACGLRESHEMSTSQIVEYLSSKRGAPSPDELAHALS